MMRIARIIAAILTMTTLSAGIAYSQTRNGSARLDAMLVDAVGKMGEGKLGEAGKLLQDILKTDSSNDAAWYYLGLCGLYSRDTKGAIDAFKKASEIDPGNYWYKDRLALAYSMSGEDDLTTATYETLLKEYPKKNEIYFTLVSLYLKDNKFDKALAAMDQIETVFGKNESVTSTKYDILLRQNKPEEALKVLEDYNKEFSSAFVLTKLGDHTLAEYKDSIALDYYKEALDLQSDYMPALLGEAEVYRIRRNYPDYFKVVSKFVDDPQTEPQTKSQYLGMLLQRSEPRFIQNFRAQIDSLYDNMVSRHPSDSSALNSAGMYYYATERMDKAKSLIRSNMEKNPESLSAAATYLQMLGYQSDWEALIPAADSAIARFPEEPGFHEMKNVALYNKKDWQGIIDNSREMIRKAQGDTSVTIPAFANIGDMYHEMGNEQEAFKYYKMVLKMNPDYCPTLNNYAYYLALKGKSLKKACSMSKKTIDKEPDNSTYLDTYGWILHLLGKNQDAKAVFKRAMIYGGKESATCLGHYATVLEALGEEDLAKVYRTQEANKKAEGKE
ncbi:MAG: tetratricopeptide repeat protein [Bacteroidales bacterium]|jgi:tetratricopeptide (TPR) repeat protein|nr:tetratricopeptide repeat protein [Bacteroidales bacterium]